MIDPSITGVKSQELKPRLRRTQQKLETPRALTDSRSDEFVSWNAAMLADFL